MRAAEGSTGTLLRCLIQEQHRYGNLTDTRVLLAVQQQALRGSSNSGGSSSLESLTQEENGSIRTSTRQEPQGQEHQGNGVHSESTLSYQNLLHGDELPTYEEAKANSQYLISQWRQALPGVDIMGGHSEGQWDLKWEHARSLSERPWRAVETNGARDNLPMSSSHSFPQLYANAINAVAPDIHLVCAKQSKQHPDYHPRARLPWCMFSKAQEHGHSNTDPPNSIYSQQHRFMKAHSDITAACSNNSAQTNTLMSENERLRKELELCKEKAASLQKLESDIQMVSEAYDILIKGLAKRESLEKKLRNKLESEIKKLLNVNRSLREQLDTATKHREANEAEYPEQKNHFFLKPLEQNEEKEWERVLLERQIQHLCICSDECQQRQEQLEQALIIAQTRNQQLKEELQRKRAYMEKVERLQSSLAQLQAACKKREALEFRLRTRLERDLKCLRAKQVDDPLVTKLSSSALQQQLKEREERILALEADITKWEQKYLEESTMKQFAMDAAATAAAQRDTTIINSSPQPSPNNSLNGDQPLSSHRHQEMENRIQVLHAQLLEKDAFVRVLEQHSRFEQGKPEKPGLWLARSVPSINTTVSSIEIKGRSLSDDQTCTTSTPSKPVGGPKSLRGDYSTQSDELLQECQPNKLKVLEKISYATPCTLDEQKERGHKTFEMINSKDAEVIEILI